MKKLQELKPLHDQDSETVRRSMLALLVLAFFSILTAFGAEDIQLLRGEAKIEGGPVQVRSNQPSFFQIGPGQNEWSVN